MTPTPLTFSAWVMEFWMPDAKSPLVSSPVVGPAPVPGTPFALGDRRFVTTSHTCWMLMHDVMRGVIQVRPADPGEGGKAIDLGPFAGVKVPDGL